MKLSLLAALDEVAKVAGSPAPSPGDSGVSPSQWIATSGAGAPIAPEWSYAHADLEGFKACGWVYACIRRLEGAVSSLPWTCLQKRGEEWEPAPDLPYGQVLEWPTGEHGRMSRKFAIGAQVQNLGVCGNSLAKIVRVTRATSVTPRSPRKRGEPAEIWWLNPGVWKPVPHDERSPKRFGKYDQPLPWIEAYKRTDREGRTIDFDLLDPADVVHAQFVDGANPLWGLSPMRSIGREIDQDVEHVRWNSQAARRMMTPDLLIVDPAAKTQPQLAESAARLEQRYAGPENARRPIVVGEGGKAERLSFSPAEMDWIESRKFTLQVICAAYGLLPAMFLAEVKYANIEQSVKYMWQTGVMEYVATLEDAFNIALIPWADRQRLWIHADTSAVPALKDSLDKRLESYERAVRSAIPPNKAIVLLDLPVDPIEGGDEPLVGATLTPLREVLAEPDKSVRPGAGALPGDEKKPNGAPAEDEDDDEEDEEEGTAAAN